MNTNTKQDVGYFSFPEVRTWVKSSCDPTEGTEGFMLHQYLSSKVRTSGFSVSTDISFSDSCVITRTAPQMDFRGSAANFVDFVSGTYVGRGSSSNLIVVPPDKVICM